MISPKESILENFNLPTPNQEKLDIHTLQVLEERIRRETNTALEEKNRWGGIHEALEKERRNLQRLLKEQDQLQNGSVYYADRNSGIKLKDLK